MYMAPGLISLRCIAPLLLIYPFLTNLHLVYAIVGAQCNGVK
jgi:hypothetical protein